MTTAQKVPKEKKVRKPKEKAEKIPKEKKVRNPREKVERKPDDKPQKKRITCNKVAYSLINQANSCYIDSLLVALFHDNTRSKVVLDMISDAPAHVYKSRRGAIDNILVEIAELIRTELKNIVSTLITSDSEVQKSTCSNLRGLLKRYQTRYNENVGTMEIRNWTHNELQPLDVISMLSIIFDLPNTLQLQQEKISTLSIAKNPPKKAWTTRGIDRIYTSAFDMVSLEDIMIFKENSEMKLKRIYPVAKRDMYYAIKPTDSFTKLHRITRYMDAPFLYIHIPRLYVNNYGEEVKDNTSIIPSSSMKLKNGKKLTLSSIIVHHCGTKHGHYTCVYRCSTKYYEYNDLHKSVTLIGSFADLKTYRNGYILKNSTCYFYL
jgi:hypothetical protein